MSAPPYFVFVLAFAAAILTWLAIFKPKRKISLLALFVLVTLLAIAFAIGRWEPRGMIDVVR